MAITLEHIAAQLDRLENQLNSRRSPWLTFRECCEYLKVGRTKLCNMVFKSEINTGKVGNQLRFFRKDCDSYLLFQKPFKALTKSQKETVEKIN
ncbi:MAG: hypothetical protein ISR95_06890 [Candidatus Marinimicrobia bacterium]|nr:hypothetical protein [Candidatus Neomarinimicrobiota bacterium]